MTGTVPASAGTRCAAHPDTDAVVAAPGDFYRRWVTDNPLLGERRALLARWLDDPTPREEIAEALGLPLGALLRAFNDTAPLDAPVPFRYRGVRFAVTGMAGVCDDIVGDRFPRFGTPVTLRCHLAEPNLLPQAMFEAADWNFMDADRPGFLGYAYGVREGDTLYLAGMQSDLAARYSYLFQGRGEGTDVRIGDEVAFQPTEELVARFGDYVPVLRRTFQRYWIDVLLGAVAAWAATEPALRTLGLLWFDLEPQEDAHGHLVNRVYRQLPQRLAADVRHVHADGRCHS
nr:cytochrome c-type [Micromonospora olivasterospora]